MSNDIALIDADILTYRIGFAYEKESSDKLVKWQIDRTITNICDHLGVSNHQTFLTSNDKSNFRFQVDKTYKGNRTQPRPKWFDTIRDHLVSDYGAVVVSGKEADDAIGIAATSPGEGRKIIVSLDKDLNQIVGEHYNFVKEKLYTIDKGDAENFLGKQLLTGDRTDNIPGLSGIGEVKAGKILGTLSSREEILKEVCEAYMKGKGTTWQRDLRRTADLIFIQRYGEEKLILPWEANEVV